jgi:hypothetical protein
MAATAIAIGASTSAALAAAEASRAREEHRQTCVMWMPGFKDSTATAETRRAYTECVALVYPQPVTPDDAAVIKALIVAGIIGAVIGAWRTSSDGGPFDFGYCLMGLVVGAIAVPLLVAVVFVACAAVAFLFT